ncbi:MAG TPA: dihydroxy-acid dehydratase, partial [Acidimicrobiales bacterium]|nr:dihydroxy-acid dehydratase [Acidimicrobiales bacterium]
LDDFDRIGQNTPLLVDCKPSGSGHLEDFDRAGGMPALLRLLDRAGLLERTARTITGSTLGDLLDGASESDVAGGNRAARHTGAGDVRTTQPTGVIRSVSEPFGPAGSIRVVRGSLAPDGAIIKAAAASPALLRHTGPALVFDSVDEAAARLDDPDLDVSADSVLVLRNAGPKAAGMPEAASLPLPRRLAAAGVRDMVRVSDARMSGTAYGTVVLHVSPEAAVGGPLALVREGDLIALDVRAGTIDLLVDDAEIEHRRMAWSPPALPARGWRRLYAEQVLPAHLGADLEVLAPDLEHSKVEP